MTLNPGIKNIAPLGFSPSESFQLTLTANLLVIALP